MPITPFKNEDGEYEVFLSCSCGSHQVQLWTDNDMGGEIEVCLWERSGLEHGFLHRLKSAWRLLYRGSIWRDQMILSPRNQQILTEYLETVRASCPQSR